MAEIESKPTVSIIIPTYNRSRLITNAVKSVLNQTYQNFELIVVDDASTDDTEEVIGKFDDNRIRYVRHSKNKGEAAARNTGIKIAKYDYIAFQDSDDEWFPQKLASQIELLKNAPPEVGVIYTGFLKKENNKKTYIPFSWVKQKNGDIHKELLKGNFIGSPVVLIKKECFRKVGLFNEKLRNLVDWEMWLRISKHYHFKFTDEPLVLANYNSDNISFNHLTFIETVETVLKKYSDEFQKNRKLLAKHYVEIGKLLVANRETQKGKSYLIKALKIYPFNIKPLLVFFLTFFSHNIYQRTVLIHRKIKNIRQYL